MPIIRQVLSRKTAPTLFSLLILCLAVQMPSVPQVSAQTSVETEFMAVLNSERATLGKNPLAISTSLSTAAYLHSKDMAEQNYFNHTSLDGRTFDQRIAAAGYTNYTSLAENIAYASGVPDAAKVYNMWKNSPGHYANLMGDFSDAGLGVYSKNGVTYYTLDLGKSRTVTPPSVPEFPLPAMFLLLLALVSASAFASARVFKHACRFASCVPEGQHPAAKC